MRLSAEMLNENLGMESECISLCGSNRKVASHASDRLCQWVYVLDLIVKLSC